MIILDDTTYKATWVKGLEQTADILNGENSGRLQGTGKMYLEYKATYFNHQGRLRRDQNCSNEDWNNLFLALANPTNLHTGTFPFGENQTLTQDVYISQVKRKNILFADTNKWENTYEVTFTAVSPGWLPGGEVKGVKYND